MSTHLISVIMPAYNGEQYIKQAIESVLAQTHHNWELIIIDDGSTDQTAARIDNFTDPRIVYIFQENRGQAAALNHGLEAARGDYITTLDVDDWYTPDSLGRRADFLDAQPVYDVVYGDGIFCDLDGNQLKRFSELRVGDVSGDVFDVMLSNSFFGTGANVMIRKSAIEKLRLRYDESIVWCQDYDFYLRLAEKCLFGYVDIPTVWYRLHTANMTMTMSTGRRKESLIRVKKKALGTPRFAKTSPTARLNFFYQLLLNDLDDLADQVELINHPHFIHLPKKDQAKGIRLLASNYLADRKRLYDVRKLLRKAFFLNPLDIKTFLLFTLSHLDWGPAARAFSYWRRRNWRDNASSNPFNQIKK